MLLDTEKEKLRPVHKCYASFSAQDVLSEKKSGV